MIWLLNWRHTLWTLLLVSLLWSSGPAPTGPEQLAGWWLGQMQQSGYGAQPREWASRRVKVPVWLAQGQSWAAAGGWLGLTLGLGWQIWQEGGELWRCGVWVLASHQLRSAVEQMAAWQQWQATEQLWAEVSESVAALPVGWVSQARSLDEQQPEGQVIAPGLTPAEEMGRLLAELVVNLPVGTNLGLLQFMWMLVSGNLLESRGALFSALQRQGLSAGDVRQAWSAFANGQWQIADLVAQWQHQVEAEGVWQEQRWGGYRLKVIDLTGFWRPTLKECPSKHYRAEAGKALPAVVLALVSRVGKIGSQRVPLPAALIRVDPTDPSEATLTRQALKQVACQLAADELALLDAGFNLKDLLAVGLPRFVLRLAANATARRNEPAPYCGRGRRPEWGERVRPLARQYRDKTIEATPPDRTDSWQIEHKGQPLTLKAEFWDNLVLADQKPGQATPFNIVAIHDPRYRQPWLLATPLALDGPTMRNIYRDRWPVEQLPLSAKQMIGAARQFVHAPETIHRLPELALLAGAILSYTAAKLPPVPTGFWDRAPKATPGRLRRLLTGRPFPANLPLPARIRKKASVTAHLPKGVLAHRRQKRVT
jgi:hypothetical protein